MARSAIASAFASVANARGVPRNMLRGNWSSAMTAAIALCASPTQSGVGRTATCSCRDRNRCSKRRSKSSSFRNHASRGISSNQKFRISAIQSSGAGGIAGLLAPWVRGRTRNRARPQSVERELKLTAGIAPVRRAAALEGNDAPLLMLEDVLELAVELLTI